MLIHMRNNNLNQLPFCFDGYTGAGILENEIISTMISNTILLSVFLHGVTTHPSSEKYFKNKSL